MCALYCRVNGQAREEVLLTGVKSWENAASSTSTQVSQPVGSYFVQVSPQYIMEKGIRWNVNKEFSVSMPVYMCVLIISVRFSPPNAASVLEQRPINSFFLDTPDQQLTSLLRAIHPRQTLAVKRALMDGPSSFLQG